LTLQIIVRQRFKLLPDAAYIAKNDFPLPTRTAPPMSKLPFNILGRF
jgi:hypothetical protein